MRMRIILGCIVMLWGSLALFAQSSEERTIRLKQEGGPVIESSRGNDHAGPADTHVDNQGIPGSDEVAQDPERDKGRLGVSVGTSYSTMKGYGSGMMFYAAPSYTLSLNERWALHGGVVAAGYQGFYPPTAGEYPFPAQFSSLSLFAAASYRMNDRLVLHGAGVKQLISAPVTPFTPYPADYFSVGATYKLGQNISIGATIHISNGGGYYSSPFNGGGYYSAPFNGYGYGFRPPYFW